MNTVNLQRFAMALERVPGWDFELFAQVYFADLMGKEFSPLGGVKDGGADGYDWAGVYETAKPAVYYQITTEDAEPEAKITKTVKRLREVGRTPSILNFVTSRSVPRKDQQEMELAAKLG